MRSLAPRPAGEEAGGMHALEPRQLLAALAREHRPAARAGLEAAQLLAMRAEQGEGIAVPAGDQRLDRRRRHGASRSASTARPRSGTPIQPGRLAAS